MLNNVICNKKANVKVLSLEQLKIFKQESLVHHACISMGYTILQENNKLFELGVCYVYVNNTLLQSGDDVLQQRHKIINLIKN